MNNSSTSRRNSLRRFIRGVQQQSLALEAFIKWMKDCYPETVLVNLSPDIFGKIELAEQHVGSVMRQG